MAASLALTAAAHAAITTTGNVTPDPADSSLTEKLYVGKINSGTMTVNGNSSLNNGDNEIGYEETGVGIVTIDGPGASWTNYGIRVGFDGVGSLHVAHGATLLNYYTLTIGTRDVGVGLVTVKGSGSTLTTGAYGVNVGTYGEGTFTIADYGRVTVAPTSTGGSGFFSIATFAGSSGTVNLQGGTLDLHGHNIDIGEGDAHFNFTGGTLTSVAQFDGDLHQQGGTLAVGGATTFHATEITGNYTQDSAGILRLELGGTADDTYDQLYVNGNADIHGALAVEFSGGFVPDSDDTFTIAHVGHLLDSVTGSFSSILNPLGTFSQTINDTTIVLSNFQQAGTVQQISSGTPQVTFAVGDTPGSGDAVATFSGDESGIINITYAVAPADDLPALPTPDFTAPTDQLQYWNVGYSGDDITSAVTLSFTYDDTGMTLAQELGLGIYHYHDGLWQLADGTVDPVNNTITIQTDSFSPFALGNVPEPASGMLALLGLGGLMMSRRRRGAH